MRQLKQIYLLAICMIISACNPSNLDIWNSNVQLWGQQAQKNYQYVLRTVPATFDTQVNVANGVVVSAFALMPNPFVPGATIPIALPQEVIMLTPTIDMHLGLMLPMISQPSFSATYNVNIGYPTSYRVDLPTETGTVTTGVQIMSYTVTQPN